jgi:hypothetical protein
LLGAFILVVERGHLTADVIDQIVLLQLRRDTADNALDVVAEQRVRDRERARRQDRIPMPIDQATRLMK